MFANYRSYSVCIKSSTSARYHHVSPAKRSVCERNVRQNMLLFVSQLEIRLVEIDDVSRILSFVDYIF